ncbi:unnamed protein product [Alternaria alternata]
MPRRIRLVDTKNREGRYACLSHFWGDKQPLRTTLKPYTLSIHQENIREEDLPKTFRDAITIIQDDEKDWQIQSAKMAAIYSNSTVTLAATEASNSEEGLFRKDPTGQLKGGYIVLSGTLIQAFISHVGVDDRDWHQAFLTPLGREREDSYRFGTDFDLTQSGHVVEDGEAVFCLEIAQGEVESKEMIWYDGEFERIGLFTEIIPQDRVNRKPFEEASPEYAVERNAVVKVI